MSRHCIGISYLILRGASMGARRWVVYSRSREVFNVV